MADIVVPRWEWRTFGDGFGDAEAVLAELEPTGVHDSDEIYLTSSDGETVKLRDGLMDIKVLREVDARGLQRWEPVLKAEFPLAADVVRQVYAALRQPVPALSASRYSFDELVGLLVVPGGDVRCVHVHKHRVRYVVGGCTGELTDVVADGVAIKTLAVELEDPETVWAAVGDLGLRQHINIAYPDALDRLLDGEPARYATIDVGTNSVKFHVAERVDVGWSTLVDRAEVTQLGEGLAASGSISDAARDRTTTAIRGMVDQAAALRVRALAAAGTAGLRSATNSADVVAAIEAATGVRVEVVSGEDESRLAYLAVVSGLPAATGSLVVFDTGGGSSQFTVGRGAEVLERWSVDVGAVRFTERFALDGVVDDDTVRRAREAIAADLGRLEGRDAPDVLVGMGGAITNLTAVSLGLATYDPDRVQGATLTREEVGRQIDLYRFLDLEARRGVVGLQPGRAGVILAGACIVLTVMDVLSVRELVVSDRGLRHGLLAERFGPWET
jgi:exopolyphosphatase/guanosine-5'-triphosphate,3'-diphosphate pyrophosphatase